VSTTAVLEQPTAGEDVSFPRNATQNRDDKEVIMAEDDRATRRQEPGQAPAQGGITENRPSIPGPTKDSASKTSVGGGKDIRDALQEGSGGVGEHATHLKDKISGQAQEIVGEAKQQAQTMLQEQKSMAADALGGFANALRQTAEQMQDRRMMAQYAERTADRIDQFSRQLVEKDLGQIIRDAEDMGRRRPEALIGGAVTAGFLLARFVKATRRSPAASVGTSGSTTGSTGENFERSPVGTASD
jgi:hypothetical protein